MPAGLQWYLISFLNKIPSNPRIEKLEIIAYIVFSESLVSISILFILKVEKLEGVVALLFITGNILYYFVGIVLAIIFKLQADILQLQNPRIAHQDNQNLCL